MSLNDLTSDFVARVNNAIKTNKSEVEVLKSKLIEEVTKKLTKLGFFKEYKVFNQTISIQLKLGFINKVKRISTSGHRVYTKKNSFPDIVNGFGYTLVSTSKGILTHMECIKEGVGGEVLLQAIKA